MAFDDGSKEITRREAIAILAVAGAGTMLGCGGGKLTTSSTSTTTTSTATGNAACILSAELTVGPYFVDEKLNRSDLTTTRPVPLRRYCDHDRRFNESRGVRPG